MTTIVVGVVTGVWTLSFLVDVFSKNYESDPMIHAIFMSIVGGAIALRKRGPDTHDKDSP